jgi:hypothetical protein
MSRTLYPRGKSPRCSFSRRLSGPQRHSGQRRRDISCPYRDSNSDPSVVQPVLSAVVSKLKSLLMGRLRSLHCHGLVEGRAHRIFHVETPAIFRFTLKRSWKSCFALVGCWERQRNYQNSFCKWWIIQGPKLKKNSLASVRKRTIPTERPPLVGEVSVSFCGWRVLRDRRNGSPWQFKIALSKTKTFRDQWQLSFKS